MFRRIGRSSPMATAILTLLLVSAVSCSPVQEPTEVSVQLKWYHQANSAGFYAAEKLGYYDNAGIAVNLIEGGAAVSPGRRIEDLNSDSVLFSVMTPEFVFGAIAQDEDMVIVAVVFKKNPYVYVSLKENDIVSPEDLVGKKIMAGDNILHQHNALLALSGIDPDGIELVPSERGTEALVSGKIDAQVAYASSRGPEYAEAGIEVSFIWFDDYGIHFAGDVIVTTRQLIRENPELVSAFVSATLEGWRYSIEHPDETVDMILSYDDSLDPEHQKNMLLAQIPLIHTGDGPVGWIDEYVFGHIRSILIEAEMIPASLDAAETYDMQFLRKAYEVE